jgi:hypothetical protein
VTGAATAIFGLFAASIFYVARNVLKLESGPSIFLTIFVIVQVAVLRTAWDLHKDVLALSMMLLVFSLLSKRSNKWPVLPALVGMCIVTVALDRMVGILLLLSLTSSAIFRRSGRTALLTTTSGFVFALLLTAPSLYDKNATSLLGSASEPSSSSEPWTDYLTLFGVLNGLIAVPALLGFFRSRGLLLGVPLLGSLAGAFSYLVLPDPASFVPERWTVLFGIFASILAGYFVAVKIHRKKHQVAIAVSIVVGFTTVGLAYATMPYDRPFVLFAVTKSQIEHFMPVTMQFNALDVRDNDELLEAIEVINRETEQDAVIVGAKHWRGFMEIHLEQGRTYEFSENPESLAQAHAGLGKNVYLIFAGKDTSSFEITKIEDSAVG